MPRSPMVVLAALLLASLALAGCTGKDPAKDAFPWKTGATYYFHDDAMKQDRAYRIGGVVKTSAGFCREVTVLSGNLTSGKPLTPSRIVFFDARTGGLCVIREGLNETGGESRFEVAFSPPGAPMWPPKNQTSNVTIVFSQNGRVSGQVAAVSEVGVAETEVPVANGTAAKAYEIGYLIYSTEPRKVWKSGRLWLVPDLGFYVKRIEDNNSERETFLRVDVGAGKSS